MSDKHLPGSLSHRFQYDHFVQLPEPLQRQQKMYVFCFGYQKVRFERVGEFPVLLKAFRRHMVLKP